MFLKGLLSESYWVQNSSSTFVFNGDILFQRNTANSECIFEGYCPFCQCYIILKEQWWYISVEQIYFALRATNTTLHDLKKHIASIKQTYGKVVLRIAEEWSSMFLSFPTEYYTLYFPQTCYYS